MLNLYQSNQMSALANAFCERAGDVNDPFLPTTVIVQSFGLGQWLKLQLAEHQGIAANIDCVLPATFLWRLYQSMVPEAREMGDSPFDRHRLAWRMMRLIGASPPEADNVARYLEGPGNSDLRRYQFASELSSLFDEYLMYRPDWMLQWQRASTDATAVGAGTDDHWQAALWRELLADMPGRESLHRAALHQRVIRRLREDGQQQWQQLSIFGLSTLPPLQLETFEVLAQTIDVDIYFLNPSEHYWGDIVSDKEKARRSIRSLVAEPQSRLSDEDYLETGNPLLASLGKQGREYLELLLESSNADSAEYFSEHTSGRALDYVRNDILNLTYGGEFGSGTMPTPVALADSSIQVHACHSRLREVEVLFDEIQRTIAANPDIRLHDIIVMVPDIADYAPFIDAVFSGLMYRISDRSSLAVSGLLNSFLSLLALPESRLTGPQVMDLLEVPAIMRRLELEVGELETLRHWIAEAGIRWEINGASKQTSWGLPPENQNSWQFGLDRLLLGFAMTPEQGTWQQVLPMEISPADAALIAKLSEFIELLDSYRTQLRSSHPMQAWQSLIAAMVADFYAPTGAETLEVDQLMAAAESLATYAADSQHEAPVSRELVLHALNEELSGSDSGAGFISGGITFATLVPMRSIPFRMVALLGLNDGEYPRDVRPHSFDLMSQDKPRRGDRSKRLDDRYLFLEAILSAEDVFYVSYIGKSAQDNKDRPPSVVASEWLAYLDAVFTHDFTHEHALQPFNPRYYQGDHRQTFSTQWYEAMHNPEAPQPFLDGPLASIDTQPAEVLSAEALIRFFQHPARYFLQQRLGVWLEQTDTSLQDTESFELDALERYQLANEALDTIMQARDLATFREQISGAGRVMAGPIGRQQLAQEINRAQMIAQTATGYRSQTPQTINKTLTVDGVDLQINAVMHDEHLLHYQVGTLKARQLLAIWIRHLCVSASDVDATSISIAKNSKKDEAQVSVLPPLAADSALAALGQLLSLYRAGLAMPPFLPPETCHAFATSFLKDADQSQSAAVEQARRIWHNTQVGSESQDRYWQRLFDTADPFDDGFATQTLAIWTPLLEQLNDSI